MDEENRQEWAEHCKTCSYTSRSNSSQMDAIARLEDHIEWYHTPFAVQRPETD